MNSNQIDRLAEFCRMADKGYRRDPESGPDCEPEWIRDKPFGVEIWRPDESDDDCRVVLEAVPAERICDLLDVLFDMMDAGYERHEYGTAFERFLLLATPAEKCKAVLKVLEMEQ